MAIPEDGTPLTERGLSFWHFPGLHDGEDIKAEFKLRLEEADYLFTADQRVDVIEEAKNIFQLCAEVVYELDDMAGSPKTAQPQSESPLAQALNDTPAEKQVLIERPDTPMRTVLSPKSLTALLRRPEITSSLVALGCLICVALLPTFDINLLQDW
ncbi:hypothetical protein N0V86_009021 [Didymella sp. IMI 355093]|nr:hypothetical protein N0V86_009021 [Didymella sp. IMI 355093]